MSRKEKVGYEAVVGTLQRQVVVAVNWDEIQNLGTVGIDEIALRKGHKAYAAVITARQDDGEVIILAVLEERKKRQCATFWKRYQLDYVPQFTPSVPICGEGI